RSGRRDRLSRNDQRRRPAYAILSHTWGKDEVGFQEVEAGIGKDKAGWEKIQFCAKQAAADGLQYFWVDTCCIDKKNAVELGAAINSMFRWYQNAARCYVYLSDVSKPDTRADIQREWEEAFRESRWFTRGWTLQELIAPKLVDFFSLENERLGSKLSLESKIYEITGIEKNALRGEALSNFSIKKRRSWAERRNTTVEEDAAYCLIGIFDVSMVPNYGETRDQAFRRLEEEIHKLYKGVDFELFAVGLNLASLPEAAQFVAREKELSNVHELLYGHSNRTCVVLHGLGGIGKTQLAIEYVRRHKERYTAIFWLNANDSNSLRLSFRDVAQQILKYHPSTSLLAGVDLNDLDQVVYAVKAWLDLQKNTRWLMIYDNYDNPKASGNLDRSAVNIRQYFPQSNQGSIIITTRSSRVSQGRRVYIQKLLDIKESLEILSNMSGREDIAEDPSAVELVKELDGLPLALSTAGAYLEHVPIALSDYLGFYKTSWLKLQTTSPQLESYEDRSLYTTWQITFDRIQQQNPASANLLKLWAYFDRQDIWFELLRHANYADNKWIQRLIGDELNFNEAAALLCSFGLVDINRSLEQQFGSGGYSMHSCVHSWTEFVLNKKWDNGLARLALRCVASKVPMRDETDSWILQRRLLLHAVRQEQAILEDKVDIKGMELTLNSLGMLYADQGKLAKAEVMYTRALQGYKEALGPKHISTLSTVNNLGNLYKDQGKLAEAEAMYTRALQGYEHALGSELLRLYLPALNTMFAFGDLCSRTGRKDKAKGMYTRALSGYTTVQGPSSKLCRQLEDRLQALQIASAEIKIGQDEFTEPRAVKSRSFKRKFHKLEGG
ncbi:hypothetical protein MMC26_000776, partial [Xylographa opegraphella]|nr:hypothetical protein [Xylographa opegraphella]